MGSPTRTAFAALQIQRRLAKQLEAERCVQADHAWNHTQKCVDGSPVDTSQRDLQDKLISQIPSLASRKLCQEPITQKSQDDAPKLLQRLREKARDALAKGELDAQKQSPHTYNLLTEELIRIAAIREVSEKKKGICGPELHGCSHDVIESPNTNDSLADVYSVEDTSIEALPVKTIRIQKDKILASQMGGGLIKRSSIAPSDVQEYKSQMNQATKPKPRKYTAEYRLFIDQLRKSTPSTHSAPRSLCQSDFFLKLID